jgi:hypothetical protein
LAQASIAVKKCDHFCNVTLKDQVDFRADYSGGLKSLLNALGSLEPDESKIKQLAAKLADQSLQAAYESPAPSEEVVLEEGSMRPPECLRVRRSIQYRRHGTHFNTAKPESDHRTQRIKEQSQGRKTTSV